MRVRHVSRDGGPIRKEDEVREGTRATGQAIAVCRWSKMMRECEESLCM